MILTLAQQAAPTGGIAGMLLPMLLVFAVFYFLVLRPQQKQQRQLQNMIASLSQGDEIITRSGIHGRVASIDNGIIQVEIAKNVQVKMNRDQVASIPSKTNKPVAA